MINKLYKKAINFLFPKLSNAISNYIFNKIRDQIAKSIFIYTKLQTKKQDPIKLRLIEYYKLVKKVMGNKYREYKLTAKLLKSVLAALCNTKHTA